MSIRPQEEPSSPAVNSSRTESTPSGRDVMRRVQWPQQQDLADHVSIDMKQQPLSSTKDGDHVAPGDSSWADSETTYPPPAQPSPPARKPFRLLAHKGLQTAREEEGRRRAEGEGEPAEPRSNQFEVFVDPNERDGLPSIGALDGSIPSSSAAWGLVRGFTKKGDLRRRRNGGYSGVNDQAAEGEGAGEKVTGRNNLRADGPLGEQASIHRGGSFLKTVREAVAAARARDDEEDIPPLPREEPLGSTNGEISGGGILSALIALQRQQAESSNAPPNGSGGTTPTHSQLPSRRNSLGDKSDEDEEEERAMWLSKQKKSRWVANLGPRIPSFPLVSRDHLNAPGTVEPNPKHHKSTLSDKFNKLKHLIESEAQDVKHFVDEEVEEITSRPSAAKSGAGVFGGLLLGAVSIFLFTLL